MDNRVNLPFRYQDDPTKACTTIEHNDKRSQDKRAQQQRSVGQMTAYDSAQLLLHITHSSFVITK